MCWRLGACIKYKQNGTAIPQTEHLAASPTNNKRTYEIEKVQDIQDWRKSKNTTIH